VVVRSQIADILRRIVEATTVVAITNRRGRMALMIAAAMASHPDRMGLMIVAATGSHPDRTDLMIVEAIVSLSGLLDRTGARASALIRVLGLALLR